MNKDLLATRLNTYAQEVKAWKRVASFLRRKKWLTARQPISASLRQPFLTFFELFSANITRNLEIDPIGNVNERSRVPPPCGNASSAEMSAINFIVYGLHDVSSQRFTH